MTLTRRHFLAATAAAATVPALAGCGGFSTAGSDAGGESDGGTLTFTTWGTDSELAGFKKAIDGFQAANPGSTVTLNAVPYEQMFTNIDAQLQAGNPPDVFRVPYYTFGAYAGRDQLLDLSSHLPGGFADRFTPQAWAAVQNSGKPYGVPHHTDTSVILYNKDAFDAAGVKSVPTTLEEAWTWDEFANLAETLRKSLPSSKYPFAYNWQGNGVTRWLSWLFEADGRFLAEDLIAPAIDSERRPPGGRVHLQLLRQEPRAEEQLGQVDHLRRRHLVRPDRRDDLRRCLPDPGRRLHPGLRVGGDVLPAQGPRRRATSAATRWSPPRPPPSRSWPRSSSTSSPPPEPMRDFCAAVLAAADPCRPGREGHRVRRPARAVAGVRRSGLDGQGAGLRPGRLAATCPRSSPCSRTSWSRRSSAVRTSTTTVQGLSDGIAGATASSEDGRPR